MVHTRTVDKNLIDDVFEKAGGRQRLRQALGLSKQTMSDWARAGCVPAKHCAAVHAKTGISLKTLLRACDAKSKPAAAPASVPERTQGGWDGVERRKDARQAKA